MPRPTDPEESGQTENLFFQKIKIKRQQYIKCFFFNETNPKDVQSGSSCAVHKHGKKQRNKMTEFRADRANPGRGWTCRQGGFSGTAQAPAPRGWAQGRRAQASPRSAPGWPAGLCPRFLGKQNEVKTSNYSQWRWLSFLGGLFGGWFKPRLEL